MSREYHFRFVDILNNQISQQKPQVCDDGMSHFTNQNTNFTQQLRDPAM
jgi:hypothetical protein